MKNDRHLRSRREVRSIKVARSYPRLQARRIRGRAELPDLLPVEHDRGARARHAALEQLHAGELFLDALRLLLDEGGLPDEVSLIELHHPAVVGLEGREIVVEVL